MHFSRLFLSAAIVAQSAFAFAMNPNQVLENFNMFLNDQETAAQLAGELLKNPKNFESNVEIIQKAVKDNNLVNGSDSTKVKLFDLQNELNRGIIVHNKRVASERRKIVGRGALIGTAVGAAVGYKYARPMLKSPGDSNSIGLLFGTISIGVGTVGGTIAGTAVGYGVSKIATDKNLDESDILDKNEK